MGQKGFENFMDFMGTFQNKSSKTQIIENIWEIWYHLKIICSVHNKNKIVQCKLTYIPYEVNKSWEKKGLILKHSQILDEYRYINAVKQILNETCEFFQSEGKKTCKWEGS